MTKNTKPTALIILDGWGYNENQQDNAIAAGNTPVWDRLWSSSPRTMVETSGLAVGLPEGQMGNSEVGHMSMGAGRVVYQNLTKISKAIEEKTFFSNPAFVEGIDKAVAQNKAVHIIGLLSPGGVHGHEHHIHALCEMAVQRGANNIFVHAIVDGRDMPPRSAEPSITGIEAKLSELGKGQVATVIGRYYSMDRDNRWDRIQLAYDAMTAGQAPYYEKSAADALAKGYERGEDDEFVQATVITDENDLPVATMEDGDTVILANYRPDRARELTHAFVDSTFDHFERRKKPSLAAFICMTEYASDISAPVAFPQEFIKDSLGEVMSARGKKQLRISETEKYAHVTFFFNGGREQPYSGEQRIMIPSPDVATYDMMPEMSAYEVTYELVEAITKGDYDLIVCNYANSDMVGHTGNFKAAVEAVEVLDDCLGRVIEAIEKRGGQALITADHGNVEVMKDAITGAPCTSHTPGPVGLIYFGNKEVTLAEGCLSDIAPTLLELMDQEVPAIMTGKSLLT